MSDAVTAKDDQLGSEDTDFTPFMPAIDSAILPSITNTSSSTLTSGVGVTSRFFAINELKPRLERVSSGEL